MSKETGKEWAGLLIALLLFNWLWPLASRYLHIAWYSMSYNIPFESIVSPPEPSGCDFFRAPIGEKACHYQKNVVVAPLGTENNTGRRFISYDNGVTRINPDEDHPAVIVSWDKVQDP